MIKASPRYLFNFLQNRYFSFLVFGVALLASSNAFASLGASVTLVSGQPTAIHPSETTELEITLSNSNPSAAIASVAFSNSLPGTLPNGLKMSGTATYTCTDPSTIPATTSSGTGTLTAATGTQPISLSGGSIPAHANNTDGFCTIILPVTAGTSNGSSTTYTYTVGNGAVTGNDGGAISNSGSVGQSVNIEALSVPTISTSFSPSTIILGSTTTLSITINNPNALPLSNFTIPDTLPQLSGPVSFLQVASSPAATSTCTSGGTPATFNPSAGDSSLSASGGTVAANGSCTVTVAITGISTNSAYQVSAYNTIIGSNVTSDIGFNISNTSALIYVQSPLNVSTSFDGDVYNAQTSSFSVVFSNSGSSPIEVNSFTDSPFDGVGNASYGLKVSGSPTVNCTSGGTAGSYTATAGNVGISLSTDTTIAAGGSCTITTPYVATLQTGDRSQGFTNNIAQGAVVTTTSGVVSNSTYANVTVYSPLNVSTSFADGTLTNGQSDTLSVVLSNAGTVPLTISSFTDSPIDGVGNLSYGLKVSGTPSISCTGSGSSAGTYAVTANNLGITQTATDTTIDAGASCTITTTFTATVQTASTEISFTNSIAQGAVTTTTVGNTSNAASTSIDIYDNVTVSKTESPSSNSPSIGPGQGNPVNYTVTVQNWTASAVTDEAITETLANGQFYLTGTLNGNNYSPSISGTGCSGLTVTQATVGGSTATVGSTIPVFAIGNIPARPNPNSSSSCTVSFWASTSDTATNGSSVSNNLGVGSVCFSGGTICNGVASNTTNATVTTNIFSVSKSFAVGSLFEGTITSMKFTFSNLSVNPLTNVTITDALPVATAGGGQLQISPVPNAASTCGSPTFTAAPNGTSFSMTGATIPGRASNGTGSSGSCFVTVDVVGPAGTYNNSATSSATVTFADGTTSALGTITSNTASLTYTSTLSATKSFSPTTVSSGGKSTVTVELSNSGSTPITNISVLDPLPGGMVLANPVNAQTTCAGSTSFSGAAGASSIHMTGANLVGNGSCEMLFNVVATGGSSWTNTIPSSDISADNGIVANSNVSATLNYTGPAPLTVAKTTSPGTISFPGQNSQLTITITSGSTAVSNMGLTDYFTSDGTSGGSANGMEIATTPAASTTCTNGIVSATAGAASVSLSGASLSANSSCTITVNVTSTSAGGITNYIPVGSISTAQAITNSNQTSTSLTTQSNIGVIKQFSPDVVAPGQRSRLTLTFYNAGTSPVSGLTLTDTLPSGMTIPVGPNFATTCSGGTVTSPGSGQVEISGANISAASGSVAASCTVSTDVLVSSQGTYVNTIAADAITATSGGASDTNEQAATATLYALNPVVIHEAINNDTLDTGNPAGFTTGTATETIGTPTTLTISLNNPNSTNLTQAYFTDSLPSGLVVAETPDASTTCTNGVVTAAASATSIGLTGATFSANATCTVTVQVLSNISGTYTNTIAVSSINTYEGVTNAYATSAEIIIANSPTVTKQFTPPVIPANGTSVLTIFLGNSNSSAATLSSALTDTLPTAPGNVLVSGTPGITTTCSGGTGAVTAVAGSGTVSYASGAQIQAGGCSISVNVTAATAGSYINNIPAAGLQTNIGNNQSAANASLTVSALGYVSGKVFDDNALTPNGVFASGTDTPISGVTINLYTGTGCSGSPLSTQSTDSAGNYLFSGLAGGTYSVCEPGQPSGTTNGITTAGGIVSDSGSDGTAGTASNPTSTTSQIVGIVLNADGGSSSVSGSTNNNFAEVIPSIISGTVFLDQNNNGIEDGSDTGISNVSIELLNSGGTVISTQTTDANGNYSFTNLSPGTYSILEPTQPSNSVKGITTAGSVANGGTAGTATATTVSPSKISSIILPPNTTVSGNDFAEIPESRTISGTVFLDYNNDGIEDNSDYGISGVTITVTGTDVSNNAVNATTTTASDGTFSLGNLPPGTYTIVESGQPAQVTNGTTTVGSAGGAVSNPSSTSSQIASIDLSTTTISAGNSFAKIPGAAPDLTLTKTHSPASFASGVITGSTPSIDYFTITPSNIGSVASSGTITIVDTLPAGMTVESVGTGTAWSCSGSAGATTETCTTNAVINANSSGNAITLYVTVASGLAGQILTNTATISGGNEPTVFSGNDTTTNDVAISAAASVGGTVWNDTNHDGLLDDGEKGISGWTVQLLLNSVVVDTATTDANGNYSFSDISPGSGYELRFLDSSGQVFGDAVTNQQGITPTNGTRDTGASTPNTSGTNTGNPAGATVANGVLENMTLLAGDNIVQQSLPLDPSGVIYDSITRNPVAGAQITISSPGLVASDLVGGTLTETTGSDGLYQFLLLSGAPSGTYTLTISNYPAGYVPLTSSLIPVCSNTINIGSTPNPAEIQLTNNPPSSGTTIQPANACPASSAALSSSNQSTTQYYFTFIINPASSANILNNNIPLDPLRFGVLTITKTTPLVNVDIGQLVPYTITVHNTSSATFPGIDIIDTLPPGFKYRTGTATLNGARLDPVLSGRTMEWKDQTVAGGGTLTFKMLLVVGSGVQPGSFTNSVIAVSDFDQSALTNVATATVRVVPDPLFDCSEVIGKVFDDKNSSGYQDQGDPGIPNVRLATVDGLLVTTDKLGRFHIACAAVPDPERGSHFVMKVDEHSLPTGYYITTENPRDVLLTRGKMSKINFGASFKRTVRVDINDQAFEENSTAIKQEWVPQISNVVAQLKLRPSILKISYTSTDQKLTLSRQRLKETINAIRQAWKAQGQPYALTIEDELDQK